MTPRILSLAAAALIATQAPALAGSLTSIGLDDAHVIGDAPRGRPSFVRDRLTRDDSRDPHRNAWTDAPCSRVCELFRERTKKPKPPVFELPPDDSTTPRPRPRPEPEPEPAPIPLPGALAMMLAALGGLAMVRRSQEEAR